MVKIKFRDVIKELFTKISTKIMLKLHQIERVTEILSFDQEVMSSIKIWPIEKVEIRFLLLAMLTQMVPSYAFCLRSNLDMVQQTNGVLELITHHIFIVSYLNFYIQKDKLSLLIDLRREWSKSLLEDLPEWQIKHKKLQKFTIIYEKITIWYSSTASYLYCLAPVILSFYKKFYLNDEDSELQLIMNFNFYYVEVRDHLVVYLIYIIMSTYFFYRTSIITQMITNMNANLLIHIGKYFEFVEVKLKALNDELVHQEISNFQVQQNEKLIILRLKNIVDLHNQAIDFVKQIESVLSPILLFTYLINTFTFCFISFNLLTYTDEFDKTSAIQMILLLIFCTYLTFIPSYACDKIIENNIRIGVEAYNLKWYGKSRTITRMLQMIIIRSQKTVGVKAGKFYFVSLSSFASMLNTALSYYTLLRTVYEP